MFLRTAMFPTAGSQKATKSIVNKWSTAGYTAVTVANGATNGAIATLSGSMTAATLKTLLSVSGVGCRVRYLTFRSNDATARTVRVKITVDGTSVYDFTSASFSVSGNGVFLAGHVSVSSTTTIMLPDIISNSTMLIEYASSLTETDKITADYIYNTEA